MMKRLFFYLLSAVVAVSVSATGEWTLQGKSYNVDTLNHVAVGPGTTLTSLRLTGAQNLNVFYTTTDLTNEYVQMRVLKAKDIIYARQEVSEMALAKDSENEQYFLGVNADFFNMRRGNSMGTQMTDGEMIYLDDNGRTQWAIGNDRIPHMDIMHIGCTVIYGNKVSRLSSVNRVATPNSLNLYTPRYGKSTDIAQNTCEVSLVPAGKQLTVGEKVAMVVNSAPSAGGAIAIPANGYVLSGSGSEYETVNAMSKGDTIEISTTVALADGQNIIPTDVVSGYPVILRDGKTTDYVDILRHLSDLHPRTAVGNDSTNTKLIMLIVDGRSKESEGCTSKVLADIMREVGCDDAINLDGGGSSELYVKPLGICNVPSDGKERTVANGLFAFAKVPVDNKIASIGFAQYNKNMDKNSTYTPVFYGYNKYGIIVDTNVQGVKLSCPKELGKIVKGGKSLEAKGSGSHTLTAKLGKLSATTTITINE